MEVILWRVCVSRGRSETYHQKKLKSSGQSEDLLFREISYNTTEDLRPWRSKALMGMLITFGRSNVLLH